MESRENGGTCSFLFDALSDGVCISNDSGEIVYMNPASERMLEISATKAKKYNFCEILCGHLTTETSRECMRGCPLRDKFSNQQAVTFTGKHGLKQGFQWEGEQIRRFNKWKGLRVRCLKMSPDALDPEISGKHFTLIEDVSVEMELERRKEEWRDMMAHDLRVPLTNILSALLIIDQLPEINAMGARGKGMIESGILSGRRMLELINDYLDLAKLDAGKMPVQLEEVIVSKLLKSCVEEMASVAFVKQIEVSLRVPQGLTVRTDPGLLIRVVQNLLSNALKFTPSKGRVSITGRSDPGRIYLSFKDTGVGISKEDISSIFDRFHQTRAREAGRIRGTGLGLTFCKEALKALDGDIRVESEIGKGSEFIVELPAAQL